MKGEYHIEEAAAVAQRAAAAFIQEVLDNLAEKRRVLEDAANHDGDTILVTMLRLFWQHRGRDGFRTYRALRKYDPAAIGEGFAILVVTRDPEVALDYMSACAAEVQHKQRVAKA